MRSPRRVRVLAVTGALVAAAVAAVALVLATGAPSAYVAFGTAVAAWVSYQAWRSGGRFEFETAGRSRDATRAPEIRDALLDVCERADRRVPATVLLEMDAPGAKVGYDDRRPVIGVDPRLPSAVGPAGLRAILAHGPGHLGRDLHTDAVRLYLPQVIGFGAFWLAALAGRGRRSPRPGARSSWR